MAVGTQKTDPQTYFTVPGDTRLLYSAANWTRIRLTLETAGPVSVGTKQNLTPVLSGRGKLLLTGVESEFVLARGNRLYVSAEAVHRVAFIAEPVPYLQQIQGEIGNLVDIIRAIKNGSAGAARSVGVRAKSGFRSLTGSRLFGDDKCEPED